MKRIGYFNKIIYFTLGFVGWFFVQLAVCSIVAKLDISILYCLPLPISVFAILVIYVEKRRWIAFGAGTAFILNGIALLSMGIFGMIDVEALIILFFLYPPFILVFNKWLMMLW